MTNAKSSDCLSNGEGEQLDRARFYPKTGRGFDISVRCQRFFSFFISPWDKDFISMYLFL